MRRSVRENDGYPLGDPSIEIWVAPPPLGTNMADGTTTRGDHFSTDYSPLKRLRSASGIT